MVPRALAAPCLKILRFLGRSATEFSQRIETLEHKSAVIAKRFLETNRADDKKYILEVTLNSYALAPWALHDFIGPLESVCFESRPRSGEMGLR